MAAKKVSDMLRENRGNCAQSVLTAFCKDYKLDAGTAYSLAQNFGSGMYLDSVCGAVTGALMVLGLANPVDTANVQSHREKMKALRTEFVRRFKEQHGVINCTALTGYNLTDPAQLAKAREKDIFAVKCTVFVDDAALILAEMLKK